MKLFQINSIVNGGSTGRIAEDIGNCVIAAGHESYVAGAYMNPGSQSATFQIGNRADRMLHAFQSYLFDRHGFSSAAATRTLIETIRQVQPDVIHLHNLHGYYLHVGLLFQFLQQAGIPVVWTLHDCWSFTGHCSHFENVGCEKWKTQCHHCPKLKAYPASCGIDRSALNFDQKKAYFTGMPALQVVAPSIWLTDLVRQSFLKLYPVHTINNGVDVALFKAQDTSALQQQLGIDNRQVILGVANVWQTSKGLHDMLELSNQLSRKQVMVLTGLTRQQLKQLPEHVIGIAQTHDRQKLAALYSMADVFINPTYADNFPVTNLEALACGTPVITYDTGGSVEAVDEQTGVIVPKGNIAVLLEKIQWVLGQPKAHFANDCRDRVLRLYNKDDRGKDYLNLYEQLLHGNAAVAGKKML